MGTKPAGSGKRPSLQFAALPWRRGEAGVEVLLVTSRDTGRWIIPKGWPITGLKPWDAAATEAFEEAGVRGVVEHTSAGRYRYGKLRKSGRVRPVQVRVFALRVTEVLDEWPEAHQRTRAWFGAARAAELADDLELRPIIARQGGAEAQASNSRPTPA